MAERAREMIEPGTEIEETGATEAIEAEEVTETTEERRGAMRDAMISTDLQEGTEISSQIAWIEAPAVAAVALQEVIETNLQCRWAAETGRRARVLHPRRRSLHQT